MVLCKWECVSWTDAKRALPAILELLVRSTNEGIGVRRHGILECSCDDADAGETSISLYRQG
jgi:hypothetical protein